MVKLEFWKALESSSPFYKGDDAETVPPLTVMLLQYIPKLCQS